jgi:hypothetical protein
MSCSKLPFFGRERGHEAIEKLEDLIGDNNKRHREIIDRLYKMLDILDAKANSLLRVNSLFITILALFWAAARTPQNPLGISHDQEAAAVLALIMVLVSTLFCFTIVRVNWKFLGRVHELPGGAGFDFDTEVKTLANVVDNRTHYYWIGWLLTLIVVLILLASLFRFPPLRWMIGWIKPFIPPPG